MSHMKKQYTKLPNTNKQQTLPAFRRVQKPYVHTSSDMKTANWKWDKYVYFACTTKVTATGQYSMLNIKVHLFHFSLDK